MGVFGKLCRNVGLMIHNVRRPGGADDRQCHEVSRKVEREKRGDVTLRRTTIEEIEFDASDSDNRSE